MLPTKWKTVSPRRLRRDAGHIAPTSLHSILSLSFLIYDRDQFCLPASLFSTIRRHFEISPLPISRIFRRHAHRISTNIQRVCVFFSSATKRYYFLCLAKDRSNGCLLCRSRLSYKESIVRSIWDIQFCSCSFFTSYIM